MQVVGVRAVVFMLMGCPIRISMFMLVVVASGMLMVVSWITVKLVFVTMGGAIPMLMFMAMFIYRLGSWTTTKCDAGEREYSQYRLYEIVSFHVNVFGDVLSGGSAAKYDDTPLSGMWS